MFVRMIGPNVERAPAIRRNVKHARPFGSTATAIPLRARAPGRGSIIWLGYRPDISSMHADVATISASSWPGAISIP